MARSIVLFVFILLIAHSLSAEMEISSARVQGPFLVEVFLRSPADGSDWADWRIEPEIPIDTVVFRSHLIRIHTTKPFRLDTHYHLLISDEKRRFLIPDGILDSLYSSKSLGYILKGNSLVFRLFAPRAQWVRLNIFDHYNDTQAQEFRMVKDGDGVWEFYGPASWVGKSYGYRLWGPEGEGEMFDSTVVVADPYSPAVATLNHYTHPGKSLIIASDDFDWENDQWMNVPMRDLIIYEMHIRDLTAHPSSGLPDGKRGYYSSLIEENQDGGLAYIQSLGVNAVELLPSQDFGNIEVPYKDPQAPVFNTWNPYARNHWGYMTSYFFAPESYYASGATLEPGKYCGEDGRQIKEFKEMVKAFHRRGIAVLMDVVYNHVSQYDYNPLKYIDKFYYFRLNDDCTFTSVSGCGNDLKTERPMARRLIIDSVIHWMKEYHIDGFRFDLAKLIDWETCDQIYRQTRQVNPHVILIAEPWGGGYDPTGFSDHDWASWNDQIRNGVKGQNPHDGLGFIFGEWQGNNRLSSLQRYVLGSLREFGGQYRKADHSVNYLESHDDHTLGDFIRIGLRDVSEEEKITNLEKHVTLTPEQLKLNKLAALFLFTSQGAVMIHEGQEYARSKVIAKTDAHDPHQGKIDHNSYNKNNETNWLNFDHVKINSDLIEYYRGLIQMRKSHQAFRWSRPEDIDFMLQEDSLFLTYRILDHDKQYLVLLNGNRQQEYAFTLPEGDWQILADGSRAAAQALRRVRDSQINIPPGSGMVLLGEK
ncbi:MAG: type I pullulanase [Calditrichia bacterium]